jgi:hypothetical protein
MSGTGTSGQGGTYLKVYVPLSRLSVLGTFFILSRLVPLVPLARRHRRKRR